VCRSTEQVIVDRSAAVRVFALALLLVLLAMRAAADARSAEPAETFTVCRKERGAGFQVAQGPAILPACAFAVAQPSRR
jgi:hypothetical protein